MSVISFPTRTFTALVADYRRIAEDTGLTWNQRLSSSGAVAKPERWNLTEIAGSPGETIYLPHLGTDKKTLAERNRRRVERGEPALDATTLPRGWQDLLRTLDDVLVQTQALRERLKAQNETGTRRRARHPRSEDRQGVSRVDRSEQEDHHPRRRRAYRRGPYDLLAGSEAQGSDHSSPGDPEAGMDDQAHLHQRVVAEFRTHRGHAEPHESVAMARLRKRLEETEAHKQLLIASHRAMLSAVGEMGGTRAWLRFFAKDPSALASLDEIGALPENVKPIQPAQTATAVRSDPSPTSKPEAMTDEHQRAD